MKIPDASHPITIAAAKERVRITHGGKVIADSRHALALKEASYPVVHYIPRDEVDFSALTRTTHASHCPYKGDAAYYSIIAGGERSRNAVWTYEAPNAAVSNIKDHLAFYPNRVDGIEEMASPEAGTF